MAETVIATVDDYLATFPEDVRARLETLRGVIRRAVPKATESISYQIPTYKIDGSVVIYFGGWSKHVAVYPANEGVTEAFADELSDYVISKGTIRFPHDERLPTGLIGRIAKFRAKLAQERIAAAAEKKAEKKAAKKSTAAKTTAPAKKAAAKAKRA